MMGECPICGGRVKTVYGVFGGIAKSSKKTSVKWVKTPNWCYCRNCDKMFKMEVKISN